MIHFMLGDDRELITAEPEYIVILAQAPALRRRAISGQHLITRGMAMAVIDQVLKR